MASGLPQSLRDMGELNQQANRRTYRWPGAARELVPTSVRTMLHRLGASARMGQDWFTKHTLAEALHVRADEVQKWIDDGLLRCRIVDAKVFRVNNLSLEAVCIDDSAPQQTIINPLLHLVCANVQRFRQGVFREPVLAHASAGSEPVQHSAH